LSNRLKWVFFFYYYLHFDDHFKSLKSLFLVGVFFTCILRYTALFSPRLMIITQKIIQFTKYKLSFNVKSREGSGPKIRVWLIQSQILDFSTFFYRNQLHSDQPSFPELLYSPAPQQPILINIDMLYLFWLVIVYGSTAKY